MAFANRLGAVELLGQHAAHQEMRPGHGAERELRLGAGLHRGIQPLGTADQEGEGPPALLPAGQQLGEALAVRCRAAEVERDRQRAVGQGGQDRLALPPPDLRGAAAGLRDFGDRERRPQPGIVLGKELGLRAGAQPADGDQARGLQLPDAGEGLSGPHIRSSP